MKNPTDHVWSPHTDSAGESHWPDSAADRDKLASRLLGACIVAAMNAWLDIGLDQLHRAQTPEWRRAHGGPSEWEKDRATRALFAAMSKEQREAVQHLLARTLGGAFFSALAKLDQFPAGTAEHESTTLDLVVSDAELGSRMASIMDGDVLDLHDRLHPWIDEFSEHSGLFQR